MRRTFAVPILALLVLLALAAAALGGGHASASGDEPAILLSSIATFSQFERPENQPPVSIHMGYGLVAGKSFEPYVHAVFVEDELTPSTERREFYAYVDQDAEAAALALDLAQPVPQYSFFGMVYWYNAPGRSAFGSLVLKIPEGTHIDYFKMRVPPFTIEKKPQPPGGGSQYGLATDGSPVTVEVWGPPPHGDANCDAAINSLDSLVMLQHGARLLDALSCAKAADVNADGTVDSRDAQLVLQYTAHLIDEL